MKKIQTERNCLSCQNAFLVNKKDKIRKYCLNCKNKYKSYNIFQKLNSESKKNYLKSLNLKEFKICHTGSTGFSLLLNKRIKFRYSKIKMNKEYISQEIKKIIKDLEKDLKILENVTE